MRINISGCPNNCAHSTIADIGLVGMLRKRNGKATECFRLFIGGGNGRNDKLAKQSDIVWAFDIPATIKRLLRVAVPKTPKNWPFLHFAHQQAPSQRTPTVLVAYCARLFANFFAKNLGIFAKIANFLASDDICSTHLPKVCFIPDLKSQFTWQSNQLPLKLQAYLGWITRHVSWQTLRGRDVTDGKRYRQKSGFYIFFYT